MKVIKVFLLYTLAWLVPLVSYGGVYLSPPDKANFDFVLVCNKLWSYVTPFTIAHRVDQWQWFRSTIRMYTLKIDTMIKLSLGTASALRIHCKRYHVLLKVGWTMTPLHKIESISSGPGFTFA